MSSATWIIGAAVTALAAAGFAFRFRQLSRLSEARALELPPTIADDTAPDPATMSDTHSAAELARFKIVRRQGRFEYVWRPKADDPRAPAEQAAVMWALYRAGKKTHPGTLEFWDGDDRRSVIPSDQR